MKRTEEPRHIDLHLPTGWAQCSVDELEQVAAAMLLQQQRTDRFHPFSWDAVKTMLVFSFNNIEIVSEPARLIPGQDFMGDEEYLVRRGKEEPWPLTVGHVAVLVERLAWISTPDSGQPIVQFPYPVLTIGGIEYAGPPPMMDGYTWTEYRQMQDWMTLYMRLQNAGRDASEPQAQFLALLFQPAANRNNDISSSRNNDEGKAADPAAPFRGFDPIRWQVILFWWSSLMRQLQAEYPKVFKPQQVGRGKKDRGPWSFYNRVTATIQKYIGLNEQEVNQGTYSVILQHMENMAEESEEMKKLNQKYKGKK